MSNFFDFATGIKLDEEPKFGSSALLVLLAGLPFVRMFSSIRGIEETWSNES